jgi:hypothetical protein
MENVSPLFLSTLKIEATSGGRNSSKYMKNEKCVIAIIVRKNIVKR